MERRCERRRLLRSCLRVLGTRRWIPSRSSGVPGGRYRRDHRHRRSRRRQPAGYRCCEQQLHVRRGLGVERARRRQLRAADRLRRRHRAIPTRGRRPRRRRPARRGRGQLLRGRHRPAREIAALGRRGPGMAGERHHRRGGDSVRLVPTDCRSSRSGGLSQNPRCALAPGGQRPSRGIGPLGLCRRGGR